MNRMENLISAILEGDCAQAVTQVRLLRDGGASSEQILINGVESAVSSLDAKCTLERRDRRRNSQPHGVDLPSWP